MQKVCVVITRPSYGRIKTVLEAVRDHPGLERQSAFSGLFILVGIHPPKVWTIVSVFGAGRLYSHRSYHATR